MIESTGSAVRTHTIISRQVLVRILWIAGFAALSAVGAQVEIPHLPVPFTMQTLMVLLAGALLGKKDGALSQMAYLAAGMAGIPVFAHFSFGPATIAGPTGGYLMSFPVAAFVIGHLLENNRDLGRCLIAMAVGLFIVFSLGTTHLYFVYTHNFHDAIAGGFLIFSWWDLGKLVLAAGIASRFSKMS